MADHLIRSSPTKVVEAGKCDSSGVFLCLGMSDARRSHARDGEAGGDLYRVGERGAQICMTGCGCEIRVTLPGVVLVRCTGEGCGGAGCW